MSSAESWRGKHLIHQANPEHGQPFDQRSNFDRNQRRHVLHSIHIMERQVSPGKDGNFSPFSTAIVTRFIENAKANKRIPFPDFIKDCIDEEILRPTYAQLAAEGNKDAAKTLTETSHITTADGFVDLILDTRNDLSRGAITIERSPHVNYQHLPDSGFRDYIQRVSEEPWESRILFDANPTELQDTEKYKPGEISVINCLGKRGEKKFIDLFRESVVRAVESFNRLDASDELIDLVTDYIINPAISGPFNSVSLVSQDALLARKNHFISTMNTLYNEYFPNSQ